jgi:hypothetical protein
VKIIVFRSTYSRSSSLVAGIVNRGAIRATIRPPLRSTTPMTIVLFAASPPSIRPDSFLRRPPWYISSTSTPPLPSPPKR